MKYLECDKYTVTLWHWIDCGSLNVSIFLYLAGMWRNCNTRLTIYL